ncbi:MAG: glycosyltransferase [Micrococcales bacterium]|nr:glycosyltransferase [Micrococcales bacterium]MCL2667327.1 glycosyltransferase [Micrococcales bacterium]
MSQAQGLVVVAMLTYQRPDDLVRAVPAFAAELATVAGPARLLVVDNDPDGSAGATVAGLGDDRVRYVHEPHPGIAAGRNRALDDSADAAVLVFVDDDEHPQPGWLVALLGTHEHTGAGAVAGAVVSAFDAEPDAWLAAGRFFDRRRLATGTPIDVAATNNLLLDLAQIPSDVRFDEAFGLTGGSDTMFTRTLHRRGVPMVWCDEAVVVDRVPASRLTRAWVLARARRSGNSGVRVEVSLAHAGPQRWWARAKGLGRGSVRVVAGAARAAVGRATGSLEHHARGRRSLARGLGMVAAATGSVVAEYTRP